MCSEARKIAGGSHASLKIGYLRSYTGREFFYAVEPFSEENPDITVTVEYGNHEDLYTMLRSGQADLVFNDQRRAFSDEYVNMILAELPTCIEISVRSPLAQLTSITVPELKNMPCILVSSPAQKEIEQEYYQNVIGIQSTFLYAENLEEARLMVIGRKGFMASEGGAPAPASDTRSIARIPLMRGRSPIQKNYCLFWKKDNCSASIKSFAGLLKAQFTAD